MGILGAEAASKLGNFFGLTLKTADERASATVAPAAASFAPTAFAVSAQARTTLERRAVENMDVGQIAFKQAADQRAIGGGHLDKRVLLDPQNQPWMFKAFDGKEQPRAAGEVAGSQVFNAIGLATPDVHLSQQLVDGKPRFGTMQKLVQASTPLPEDVRKLTPTQIDDLQRAQVGRWLVGDFDGKAANHLALADGHAMPIDLGNMYRHFPGGALDRFYKPNPDTPLYNTLWQGYVNGHVNVDFKAGLDQIAKVEALPDQDFVRMLRPYAEGRYAAGDGLPAYRTADDFLAGALERKQNIRTDFNKFYASVQAERRLKGIDDGIPGLQLRRAADQGGLNGGHLAKQIMVDGQNRRWLSKSAPDADSWRNVGDAVGSDILNNAGIQTPKVYLSSYVAGGQRHFNTLQQMVPGARPLPADVALLTKPQQDQLTEQQVGRWLLGDHDGKLENHVMTADGNVLAIDLGQMFKFFPEDSLSRAYNPNAGSVSAYNKLADAYVKGRVNIDFAKGLAQAEKIAAQPDAEFAARLRPYAEARYRSGNGIPCYKTAEELVQAAVTRKQNLVSDFLVHYDSLAKERGLSGLEEAMGPAYHAQLDALGLVPTAGLDPHVRAAIATSQATADRYRNANMRLLNKQLGSRGAAEAAYTQMLADIRAKSVITAQYPGEHLQTAVQEGKLRTIYDLPPAEQQAHGRTADYMARRESVDQSLGLRQDNPLYVTVDGAREPGEKADSYGNVQVRYKTNDLAPRTLFTDGNHFYYAGQPNGAQQFAQSRLTWGDLPHLIANRMLVERANPGSSRLIEGAVYGGINPSTAAQSIQVLSHADKAGTLIQLARARNILVSA